MTQTIEQLQAKVAELEEENARLNLLFVKAAKGKGENLKECFSLQHQLAAIKAENEWQPIETAPKGANGYAWMLLAWGPEHDQSTGTGMRDGEEFYAAETFYCLTQIKRFEFREIKVKPTHWMPLPKPPVAEGEEK